AFLQPLAQKELQPLVSRVYVKERELMDNMMKDELYNAAAKGRFEIFDKQSKTTENDIESRPPIDTNYFCSQTPGGSNIVHIALRHGKVKNNGDKFIKIALEKHPILSMQPDSNGDTPLHLAAKWKSGATIMNLLIAAVKEFNNDASYVAPWAVKNYKGSFPIHEALESGNLEAAKALLECDNDAASRLNDLGDTALHSFAKNDFSVGNKNDAGDFVEMLLKENNQAAYMRDDEGLTPLLSAARSGRLHLASAILNYYPQSAYLRDPGGRTFLHLLRFTGDDVDESLDDNFKRTGHLLFDNAEADAQRLVQDYEGNTPLHYAIITGNSIAAIVLTHKCLESEDRIELGLVNKQGQTVPDLLALHDVPHEVRHGFNRILHIKYSLRSIKDLTLELVWSCSSDPFDAMQQIIDQIQKKLPRAGYLARSSYGIRKTEMKESANALSVVAALLATITFAAAFQVPGGFGEDGHPILLSKLAFIIFSVANTIAMCSSMLCLFLILWVMGIGKMHGSLKILDISIILLRLSFYLTLLAFTTGMFVATAEKSLWMGVLVCVFGTLTFLLTFKISIQTVAKYVESTYTGIKIFMKPVKSKNV
ncbi:Ankyrin repeat-containing protein NPR4, partial [Bienertia sinuspersici]